MKKEGSYFVVILILILFVVIPTTLATEKLPVDLYLFYGQGCPHCAQAGIFLDDIKNNYPQLTIIEKEIYFNDKNRDLFEQMAASYGEQIQ